jgi:hypothetical protein
MIQEEERRIAWFRLFGRSWNLELNDYRPAQVVKTVVLPSWRHRSWKDGNDIYAAVEGVRVTRMLFLFNVLVHSGRLSCASHPSGSHTGDVEVHTTSHRSLYVFWDLEFTDEYGLIVIHRRC